MQPAADAADVPHDTFCTYLARQLIAKKGFSEGTVPEANELADYCDIILTRHDGLNLTIACLVDREAHPGKTFALSPYAVEAVGEACLKYTGRMNFAKMPVFIEIFEVGPGSPDGSQPRRHAPHKRPSWFSKVDPCAWIIDTASGAIWTNAQFDGRLRGRRFFENLLRSPREAEADLRAPVVVATPKASFPWLTWAILLVLIGVFAVEATWTQSAELSASSLAALGGLSRSLALGSGEWYRLFSAPLLHANPIHLLMNGIALVLAGRVLEGLVGRAWFAVIFVVGALCGSILSLAVNPEMVVSVGASGAVMGLFAAMLVVSMHFPPGAIRTSLQVGALYVLVPSLLPLASVWKGQHVDYAAHFGGAFGGVVAGLVLVKIWPENEPRPGLPRVAFALALAGLVAFAYPLLPLIRNHPLVVLSTALIPQAQMPQSDEAAKAQSAQLVAQYPRDPRARLFHAITLLDMSDRTGAERELRAGLAEEDLWRPFFSADLSDRLRTVLAVVMAEDRPQDAKTIAQPLCDSIKTGPLRALLDRARLCGT